MDAATIQSKIYTGYGKAAQYVGQKFNLYRVGPFPTPSVFTPLPGVMPLNYGTMIGVINAATTVATASGFPFEKAGLDKSFLWSCLADGAKLAVGDILQSGPQTFFIAAMQPLLPIATILVNATLTLKRPAAPVAYGIIGYQGETEATETLIASWVPAAVRMASSGKNTSGGALPGDSPGPIKYNIFLPVETLGSPPVMERDIIYDDLGRRFQVSGLELTPIGPRIDCVRLTA